MLQHLSANVAAPVGYYCNICQLMFQLSHPFSFNNFYYTISSTCDICYKPLVICQVSFVICRTIAVICHTPFDIFYTPVVICHTPVVSCHTSVVTFCTLAINCQAPIVICRLPVFISRSPVLLFVHLLTFLLHQLSFVKLQFLIHVYFPLIPSLYLYHHPSSVHSSTVTYCQVSRSSYCHLCDTYISSFYRKWKDKNDRVSRSLKNTDDELAKSQRKVKRLQEIADDKKLEEREDLSRRLSKSEGELEERNHRIQVGLFSW